MGENESTGAGGTARCMTQVKGSLMQRKYSTPTPIRINGDGTATILLNSPKYPNRYPVIDECDVPLVEGLKWSLAKRRFNFYAVTEFRENGKRSASLLHNLIMGETGIDHADGDGLNNRRSNLRKCSHAQNMTNTKSHRDTASGYRGVVWRDNTKNWAAIISKGGVTKWIGRFNSKEEAAIARDNEARKMHGEWGVYNFPLPGERGVDGLIH